MNCSLYDSQGKEYIDLEAGVWCVSVGHGHPRILSVIAEQYGKIAHHGFNYSSPVLEEAAQTVQSLLQFQNGGCVFLCSGSEAVEYGVRVAKQIVEQPLFLTMADSYFGAYGSAKNRAEDEWFCFDWTQCAMCPDSKACCRDCEHWASIPMNRIGALVFEPGSSSGLVRFPPGKLIQSLVNAVKRNNGIVLANEVTTGVGRTGLWFGFQHYGFLPDIVALGKGLGNGYPVSAAAFAPGVAQRLGREPIPYAQSHQNDPLGARVAQEVIRIIRDEKLIERCQKAAILFLSGLEKIKEKTSRIKEIRARGLMMAIELEDDSDASFTKKTQLDLLDRGFVLGRRPGVNVLRMDPSLTIEDQQIKAFLVAFEDVISTKT